MLKAVFSGVSFAFALLCLATAAQAAVTIDPPAGWNAVDLGSGPIKYEGAWAQVVDAGAYAQNINLLTQAVPGMTLAGYTDMNEKQLKQMDQSIAFSVNEQIKCGTTTMQRIKYSTTFGSRKLALEQVWVLDAGTFYVGTYARLVDQPELPAASQALTTMCNHLSVPAS